MRSSTVKLCTDIKTSTFLNVTPSDLDQLLAVYSSPQAAIRTNIVNIMGDSFAAKNLVDQNSSKILLNLDLYIFYFQKVVKDGRQKDGLVSQEDKNQEKFFDDLKENGWEFWLLMSSCRQLMSSCRQLMSSCRQQTLVRKRN
jgi:hypothetical protein